MSTSDPIPSASNEEAVPNLRPRTLREVVAAYGTPSPEMQVFYDRAFAVLVDGEPLGVLEIELQGSDPDLHITFTEDFGILVDTVYLLDAAGYRNFQIKRRPRSLPPDLELRLEDGREVYFEHTRALDKDNAQVRGMREQINVRLRAAMHDDPSIEAANARSGVPPESFSSGDGDAAVLGQRRLRRWHAIFERSVVVARAIDRAGEPPLRGAVDARHGPHVDDRHEEQREEERARQAADDDRPHRLAELGAFGDPERERQHAGDHCDGPS